MFNDTVKHLQNVILPFWKNLRDEENGGFYGYVDYDLNVLKTANKGCILNSRILWFFSNAYLTLKDEQSLMFAEHAFKFLVEKCIDKKQEGIYWELDYKGNPVDDSKHSYNQAFGIYALSAYYEASGNVKSLELATKLFDVLENKCKAEIGYNEAFSREFNLVSNEKLVDNEAVTVNEIKSTKTMNTVLHILEAYTEYYKVSRNEVAKNALLEILNIVETKIYNSKEHKLEVFFDDDYNSVFDMHSYGHDIEAAWLIDRATDIIGDKELSEKFSKITTNIADEVLKLGMSGNVLFNERVNDKVDKTRVWWVQAEACIGYLNEYMKNPSKSIYLETSKKLLSYIYTNLTDKRKGGEWFWELDEHDLPSNHKPIVESWKCPYHNGRMCFEIIKRRSDLNK